MSVPFEIEGDLAIEGPGMVAMIRGEGRVVVCDLPNVSGGLALLKQVRQALVRLPLAVMLTKADVRLSVRLRGRVIAEAGPGIATGRLAALLGLEGVRLRFFRNPLAR